MIVVERRIFGLVRYLKVFLATQDELASLITRLRPFDILRAFWPSPLIPDPARLVVQTETRSAFVDLSRGREALYAGMHANCRYKVRRAEKMRDRIQIVINTRGA